MKIQTVDGLEANLDEKHWKQHILIQDPELEGRWDWAIETLKAPDFVYRSKRDFNTRIYIRNYRNFHIGEVLFPEMPLRVYVRESGGFVVTAYFSAAAFRSLGEKLWPL